MEQQQLVATVLDSFAPRPPHRFCHLLYKSRESLWDESDIKGGVEFSSYETFFS